jgi:hypothetical protein
VQLDADVKALTLLAMTMRRLHDDVTLHDAIKECVELRRAPLHVRGHCS